MESAWTEVHQLCDTNPSKIAPVSALCWDPYQELLWVGNDSGRVTSYYGKGMQRYTSYKTHIDQQVRQIRVVERGVISLTHNSLQMRDRQGQVRWTIREHEHMKDLHCMTTTTLMNGELLVAGQQDHILVVNAARGAVTKSVSGASNIVVMRHLPRAVCCGGMLGEVTMRDTRTMKVEQRIQAHTATLSDLDISGNLLLTCGFSQRQSSLVMDPLVKVYDIRMAVRSLAPIPFPSGPMFLKMHPTLSSTCLIASQTGQFQVCDVSSLSMGALAPSSQFYQVQTSSYITAMDISSSGQTLAIGDGNSFVYQYADRENYTMNPYSVPVVTPDPSPAPNVTITENSPLSAVGMPYYTDRLLSAWTHPSVYDVGYPAPVIDDDMLKSMKTIDFVGYAPNPGNMLRNQVPRRKKQAVKRDIPKFRSEQERELLSARGILDDDVDMMHSGRRSSSVGDIQLDPQCINMPHHYRQVEIQYSKFGVDDFDFGYYNQTIYGGLETNIRNSYCNSLLQVLYFILPLRYVAKCHIGLACEKENCLLCELGFLFRMLEDSKGQNCQATNFLKAFSTIPQASALGLFEPESPTPNISYAMLMQNFTRFILEQLHQEASTNENPTILTTAAETDDTSAPVPSTIQQLFGLRTSNQTKCTTCNNEATRVTYPFVVDLLYPKKPKKRSFTSVLKGSMHRETQTKAWCAKCAKYQPTTTKKIIKGLPGTLFINSGASSNDDMTIWRQNGPNANASPASHHDSGDSPSENTSSWVPERIGIRINGSDLLIKAIPVDAAIPTEFQGPAEVCAIYQLTSSILQAQAEDEHPHLVAQIKIPDSERETYTNETGVAEEERKKSPWYLFNDFLVKRIRPEEVASFKGNWKVPSVLQYTRVDVNELLDLSTIPSTVDYSILFETKSIAKHVPEKLSYEPLTHDEMPKPGTLVAIDSEFVALKQEETEIRSDGTKSLIRPSTLSLARLSIVRGEDGDKEGQPFIDDYILTSEPVVDYLTEFSGIEADDLDPNTSQRTLVHLKVAYKKIRLLVDLGCVFIGHGLKKDFRIINILVPPEQIIDTVDIYHIRNRHRKISLRFLAWHLLDQEIQSEGHDSIVDAQTALVLYKKYLEFCKDRSFGRVLEGVYEAGHKSNWLKGPKETPVQRSAPPTPQSSADSPALFNSRWAL
ncbi:ubiquitin carboxyl-terminal hydrolase-domain-containing protein [Gongronella butleri]|nr:ubiquitin carboxyl-terminal hydrolase-domain-containing protein [Gongronella butleri]